MIPSLSAGRVLAIALSVSAVDAQAAYPDRPIRIVVALAPGGALDATVRVVAQALGEELKQSVIVENKPGGGSLLGYRYVKGARPDGYTLLAASSTLVMLPWIRKEPGYDPLKDFEPVSPMVRMPFVLVASPATRYRNLADVLARARSDPSAVSYASAGIGTTTHLAAAKLFKESDVTAMHVPYNGNGAAMTDVLGGRVQLLFEQYGVAQPHLAAGKLVALGVTTKTRSPAAANIPTLAEQGVTNFDYAAWNGIFAPAGTPRAIIDQLNMAMHKALSKPEVVQRIRSSGDEPMPSTTQEFRNFVTGESASLGKLIQDLGIPKE
ncbi:ABC transporter substrate-binding protein (plasmid) [Cupriavidus necator]|uniref:ABC transporter substrate-binding protein n=1 Tax=Cupriavidus necator TaxID=106590 RepID=A0A1U9V3C5_CUPNE|nr:tripartite tricarboxylate transporter substrate binding protein [Cupriavidus necator]AQV99147.1 ABC transporter substrate-binding protein [Cupriavidus necator]